MLAGLLVVAPPVDRWAHELFSVHMGQHLALALVVAPLIVLGRPVVAVGSVLGRVGRLAAGVRRVWVRGRDSVGTAVALAGVHAGCWYLWHLPGPYDAALRMPLLHGVEHVMLVLSGVIVAWSALVVRPLLTAAAGILLSMLAVAPSRPSWCSPQSRSTQGTSRAVSHCRRSRINNSAAF